MILLKIFLGYLMENKWDSEHIINLDEIEELKKENKLFGYIDKSAKNDVGINQIFEEIEELLFKIKGKRKKYKM